MFTTLPRASRPEANRVLLHGISWEQFEKLLENLGESRAASLAYHRVPWKL